MNRLPLSDSIELTLTKEKRSGETTNQDNHCHGYVPFLFSA